MEEGKNKTLKKNLQNILDSVEKISFILEVLDGEENIKKYWETSKT